MRRSISFLRPAFAPNARFLTTTIAPIPLRRARTMRENEKEVAVSNLLRGDQITTLSEDWDTSASTGKKARRCVLSVLVDNEAGVLSKVSGLLASRGFNIESLTVSSTDIQDLSRMTVVLNGTDMQMEQAQRQLEDLVDVWAVVNLTDRKILERELLVIKVDCIPPTHRAEETQNGDKEIEEPLSKTYDKNMAKHFHRHSILEIAKMFGGNIADIGSEHIIIDMIAPPKRIDAFMHLIQPFGVIEAARSGVIAMQRAKVNPLKSGNQDTEKSNNDDLILPPS